MHGIHAAFTGWLGTNAELKYSKGGEAWVAFSVAVDTKDGEAEAPPTWVRVALFEDKAESLTSRLTKGTEVYVEGRLSLDAWAGKDGEVKTGLSLAACEVQPMGQLGRKKPKPPKPQEHGHNPVPFNNDRATPIQ